MNGIDLGGYALSAVVSFICLCIMHKMDSGSLYLSTAKGEFTALFILSLVPVVNMVIMLISITSILHPLEKDVDKHIQRWL